MAVSIDRVECLSDTCRREGARYLRRDDELVTLGKLGLPNAASAAGHVQLLFGIWRYTTLPGLEELHLERTLRTMDGVEVTLWPNLDEYDLDVRRGSHRWRIDVKDHASAIRLGERLLAQSPAETTWIVVPDARREQVTMLQRLCRDRSTYRFATTTAFVRVVERSGSET